MRPLDLDDLAALQADLDLLDERDLITELAPGMAIPRTVLPLRPATGGRSPLPPQRPLPPVPPPVDRPVRRTGPLPPIAPTRAGSADVRPAGPRLPVPAPVHRARPGAAGRGLLSWALSEVPW